MKGALKMKLCKRLIPCLIVLVMLLCSLTSCIDGDRAKGTVSDFLAAVEKEDFELAETYLHPERPADLKEYFNMVEEAKQVDFQAGIEILRYSGFKSSHYDSTVGGSTYETTVKAEIGGKNVSITVEVVENDVGYGIYNFTIDF